MVFRGRSRDRAAALLETARATANLGSIVRRAEYDARSALRVLGQGGLLERPTSVDLELLAESCLLIGRMLRLRGRQVESRAWIERAAAVSYDQLRTRVSPRVADRYAECSNHLTLIELNLVDASVAGAASPDHRRLDSAVRRQQEIFATALPFPDRDDHYLEMVQRTADVMLRQQSPRAVAEYLGRMHFEQYASSRPDHNRALRMMYVAHIATKSGNPDAGWRALEGIESLHIVHESNFIQFLYLEKLADLSLAVNEDNVADRYRSEAARLRSLENVKEV